VRGLRARRGQGGAPAAVWQPCSRGWAGLGLRGREEAGRASRGRGRGAGRALAARVSHTRRLGRRRQRQAPPGRARVGAGCLPPSLAGSPACLLAGGGVGLVSTLSERKKRGRERQVPSAAADPGRGAGCGSDPTGPRLVAGRTVRASTAGDTRAFRSSRSWARTL
jgi:hypothetical protein